MSYGYDKCDGDGCQVTSNRVPFPHEPGCRYGTGDPGRDRLIRDYGTAPDLPDIILPPVFGTEPRYGCLEASFLCPRGCGPVHVEHPGIEPQPPIQIPVPATASCPDTLREAVADLSQQDLSQAIAEAASARADEVRQRIRRAFADHYAAQHPGIAAPVPATA